MMVDRRVDPRDDTGLVDRRSHPRGGTGLVRVRLSKPWGPRKVGEVLEVDPARAEKLVDDGLASRVRER